MAVPKIRFPGFTDAWEQRKLGEISEKVRGNDGRMDLPTLTISAGNGWMNQEDRFSGNIAGTEQKNYTLLKKGQLSYNHGNSKLAKYGAVFELRTYEEALVPRVYHSFKTTNEADPAFIEYLFASKLPDIELSKLISSGARMNGLLNINYDQFMGISIKLPAVEEQIRIGQFFRNVDYAITLHQRKLESMKLLKKSLLQKMFPKSGETVPEVRFPGFTDAWEQRKFEDIAKRRSDSTISSRSLPCVEYEDVISEQGTLNKDISQKENAKTGIVFESGDVLFGKLRPYLKNWLLPDFNGVAVGDWWILKPVSIDGNFLYRLIQTNEFMSVANVSSGSKMPRSDWALVSKTYFSVPPDISEQRKIGTFFRDIDHTITLHQRKLESMKLLKKSLLQKMFPKSGETVPEVRFPGFTDAWEQRKLGEISEKVTTKNQDMVVNEVFTNSAEYGIISQQDFFDKDIANSNKVDGYYLVEPDDFVYNPRISNSAPFGPIKRNKLGRSGAMSPLYYVFRSHDVDKSYLDWFFQTNRWHAFMRFHGNTGVRSDRFAITDKIFAEMTISIPQDIDEQKAIGTFFTALDDSITLHQRELICRN